MDVLELNDSQRQYFRKWLLDTYQISNLQQFYYYLPYLKVHHSSALIVVLYSALV